MHSLSIIAASAASIGSPLPLLFMALTLLLPLAAVMLYVFWPPPGSTKPGMDHSDAPVSMHDDLWNFLRDVENNPVHLSDIPSARPRDQVSRPAHQLPHRR